MRSAQIQMFCKWSWQVAELWRGWAVARGVGEGRQVVGLRGWEGGRSCDDSGV